MIRAVARALAIFDVFDEQHLSLTLHEIGLRLGMPKATTFRLVNTLERAGFLIRLENQQYCLSLKLVRLAGLVRSTVTLRDVARPVMMEVNRLTGETITLNTIDGANRMCLEVVDTPSPLMSIARPGERVSLLYGATSRILLTYMSAEERAAVLAAMPEAATIDKDALERELQRFQRQGYAITRSQRVQGVTAIAVPVLKVDGKVHECLALTGPSGRVDVREGDLIEMMLAAGNDLSTRLGGPPRTGAGIEGTRSLMDRAGRDAGDAEPDDDEDEDDVAPAAKPARKRKAPAKPRAATRQN
jgi:DNA-binding IclR family transcriptional regulator